MEAVGQSRDLGGNGGSDRDELDEWRGHGLLEPVSERQIQLHPSKAVQRGNLPKSAPRGQQRRLWIGFRQDLLLPSRKSRVLLKPPKQNVGIEQSFQSSALSASQDSAGNMGSTISPTTLTVPKSAC